MIRFSTEKGCFFVFALHCGIVFMESPDQVSMKDSGDWEEVGGNSFHLGGLPPAARTYPPSVQEQAGLSG